MSLGERNALARAFRGVASTLGNQHRTAQWAQAQQRGEDRFGSNQDIAGIANALAGTADCRS